MVSVNLDQPRFQNRIIVRKEGGLFLVFVCPSNLLKCSLSSLKKKISAFFHVTATHTHTCTFQSNCHLNEKQTEIEKTISSVTFFASSKLTIVVRQARKLITDFERHYSWAIGKREMKPQKNI